MVVFVPVSARSGRLLMLLSLDFATNQELTITAGPGDVVRICGGDPRAA